jgi:thiamine biosynthesis protein ThiS
MKIAVTVNGEAREVESGTSVATLVRELGLDPQAVAVERNRALVRRAARESTELAAGDTIEIVTLVGGG